MKLSSLYPDAPFDAEITSITADSRKIEKGSLFAALPGSNLDGTKFIDGALEKGAAAIIAPNSYHGNSADRIIRVENPRLALAQIAARFYPNQPPHLAAVTGTNGKTSTAWFAYQLLSLTGHKGACLGTMGFFSENFKIEGKLTTPEPVYFHEILDQAVDHDITHLCFEASSHGLDQHRIDGAKIQIAAFTNLSPDHLDYHKDMDDYFKAKLRLFSELLDKDGVAVINADEARSAEVMAVCQKRNIQIISFGFKGKDLKIKEVVQISNGQKVTFTYKDQNHHFTLPFYGEFQVENAFAALGICLGMGVQFDDLLKALPQIKAVPGRMEPIPSQNGAKILVDYAHMGEALEKALASARSFTKGKLVVLLGCGGDRPIERRIEMGKVAEKYADVVYITDDNPRSEDPAKIRKMILEHCPKAIEIADRKEAIETAIKDLAPEDTLIIAGKGHEQGQIIGDEVLPFDDRVVASKA